MADMLATGAAWLDEQLTAHASVAWTYRRGNAATGTAYSATVYITEESQRLRVSDRQGGTMVTRPDFAGTIATEELVFNGTAFEPQDGDTVERAFGSVTKKFRLTPPNVGEPSWHYTDPQQNRVRIFGKRISNG